jgi:hypothetical protein
VQQDAGRCRVGDHSFASALGGLDSDADSTTRRIEIVCAHGTQLLATQASVVRQRQHKPIAQRLGFGCFQKLTPLLVGGNPRQLRETRYQPALSMAGKTATWCVATPANGIALAQTLLDEVIVKQADGHQA